MDFKLVCGFLVVGLIWGVTNALMEEGANDSKKKVDEGNSEQNILKETGSIFMNWKFMLPFLIN